MSIPHSISLFRKNIFKAENARLTVTFKRKNINKILSNLTCVGGIAKHILLISYNSGFVTEFCFQNCTISEQGMNSSFNFSILSLIDNGYELSE